MVQVQVGELREAMVTLEKKMTAQGAAHNDGLQNMFNEYGGVRNMLMERKERVDKQGDGGQGGQDGQRSQGIATSGFKCHYIHLKQLELRVDHIELALNGTQGDP